jgi:hypothetical protein
MYVLQRKISPNIQGKEAKKEIARVSIDIFFARVDTRKAISMSK